jgi:hypothetical protein
MAFVAFFFLKVSEMQVYCAASIPTAAAVSLNSSDKHP